MSRRNARWLFVAFLAAYTVALTWPGMLVANRIEPRILGLPLSFFWVALWVAAGFFVLLNLHVAENREREPAGGEPDGGDAGRREPGAQTPEGVD